MMTSSRFTGAHQDVLGQKPTDPESKKSLVEEIKSRARMAFGRKDMPVCEALYGKAIEVLPDAPLYSNRSAVRLALGKFEEAAEDGAEQHRDEARRDDRAEGRAHRRARHDAQHDRLARRLADAGHSAEQQPVDRGAADEGHGLVDGGGEAEAAGEDCLQQQRALQERERRHAPQQPRRRLQGEQQRERVAREEQPDRLWRGTARGGLERIPEPIPGISSGPDSAPDSAAPPDSGLESLKKV